MHEIIPIGIAEDHGLVRKGFVRMLSDFKEIKVLFEACNGKELLKGIKQYKPAVVLLDIAMPVLGGIKAIEKIKQLYPKLKIVVISAYSEETSIIEYVQLGANSFLNKDCTVEMMVEAIHKVYIGEAYFDNVTKKFLMKYGIFPGGNTNRRELTERETIILKLFCAHKSIIEISELMGLSEKTVNWYKHILLQKTNCKNADELILFAKKSNEYDNLSK